MSPPLPRLLLGAVVAAAWFPFLFLFAWPGGSLLIAAMTFPLAVLVGLPLAVVLRARLGFPLCLFAGAAIGGLGAIPYWLVTDPMASVRALPLMVVVGVFSGALFWVVGVRKDFRVHDESPNDARPHTSLERQ